MSVVRIGCIVEGHGDDKAVPIVVQRVARTEVPATVVIAETLIRRDRGHLIQQIRLVADIEFVARRLVGQGSILVVLDADDDCPATLGPQLQGWAQNARPDIPIAVVLAAREFESWFLASAESLRGHCDLSDSLESHPRPEGVRDAKGWLSSQMPRRRSYSPSADQPDLTRIFDLSLARARSDSFDKCYREITRLLHALA